MKALSFNEKSLNTNMEVRAMKRAYFSVSLPLLKENLKRYTAIPVISFLVYFMLGLVPVFISENDSGLVDYFIQAVLRNTYPVFTAMLILLPVITGVIVFRYLHAPASVTALHSMPFTRGELFNTYVLSGLIMVIAPVLLTGAIMLFVLPLYSSIYTDIFIRGEILRWMRQSVAIIIALYAVTVFAGVLTGNSIVQSGTSILIHFIAPALFLIISSYSQIFLYGFEASNSAVPLSVFWSSPLYAVFAVYAERKIAVTTQIFYVLGSAALLGFSMFLYYRRKLERASDSFVFSFMTPLISFLAAFLGMNLTDYQMIVTDWIKLPENYMPLIIGMYIFSAAIFFLAGRMVAKKTLKVFNKQTAVSFGMYALFTVAFILTFTLDLTGFEKRVPSENSIDSVTVTLNMSPLGELGFVFESGSPPTITLSTKDNINAVRELHRKAIANREEYEEFLKNEDFMAYSATLPIHYKLGPRLMHRIYNVTEPFVENSAELKQIFESEEYKTCFSSTNANLTGLTAIEVYNGPMRTEITGKSQMDELLNCVDLDFKEQTYEDVLNLNSYYAFLYFKYEDGTVGRRWIDGYRILIPKSYKNTVAWFKENGYSEQIEISPDIIEKLTVYKYYESPFGTWHDYKEEPSVTITDKGQIAAVLDAASNRGRYTDKDMPFYIIELGFTAEFAAEHTDTNIIYEQTEETAPAFLRELF